MHLILDGYGGSAELLQDEEFLYNLLDKYPAEIGMNKISPPYVVRYIGNKPEDWGLSGIVLIAESHISIHTFVERRHINMDVFSCKDFDADKVVEDIRQRLQMKEMKVHLLDRHTGDKENYSEGNKSTFVKAR